MKKKYTIKDIARLANVSVSTVSRVLNDATDVNEKTRQNIKDIIEKVKYNPNPAAMALVNRKTKYVGVAIPSIHHSSISKTVQGIMRVLHEEGYDVILFDFDYDESNALEKRYYETLDQKMIDGLIMITSVADDKDILITSNKVPTVLVERSIPESDITSIIVDENSAMLQIVDYLLRMGHQRIGFINGEKGTSSADRRLKSFEWAMKKRNLVVDADCVRHTKWSLHGGKDAFIELMSRQCQCTALVFASDQMALGAIGGAYEMQISVPEDISIVGFDNYEEGMVTNPPLTTMDYPSVEIGEIAARSVLEKIYDDQAEAKQYVLPLDILIRHSVKDIRNN